MPLPLQSRIDSSSRSLPFHQQPAGIPGGFFCGAFFMYFERVVSFAGWGVGDWYRNRGCALRQGVAGYAPAERFFGG